MERTFCDKCGGECGNPWYASKKYYGDFCSMFCREQAERDGLGVKGESLSRISDTVSALIK